MIPSLFQTRDSLLIISLVEKPSMRSRDEKYRMPDVWQAYARLQHVWQEYATYALSRREPMSSVFRRHMPTPAVCHMYTDDIRLLLCMSYVYR